MDPILVTLDKPREIKWTHRADARLGSLDRPPILRDLAHKNPRRGYYAMLAFLWAALVERHDFAEPDVLADYLGTTEQQTKAFESLRLALVEAGIIEDTQKKTVPGASNDSSNGHSPSSNSEQPVPATTT